MTARADRGDGIRIGIDAPRGIKIQREEVLLAVADANIAVTRADESAEAQLRQALGLPTAETMGGAAAQSPDRPTPGR